MNANYVFTRLEKRRQIMQAAQGLAGETGTRLISGGSAAWSTGDQRATLAALLGGERITNLFTHVAVVGSGLTLAKLGIWSAAGALLASTADISGQLTATGVKGGALSGPWTVPDDGAYFVGGVIVGTTPPTLLRHNTSVTGFNGQPLTGSPLAAANTAKADIGALTVTASGSFYWFGWN